ncbi:MAG: orotidine-5'-phosphate decarboxylase, partial [Terriglobales bacterium]
MTARSDPCLIVALDFPNWDEAGAVVERLGERITFYKVGLELFTAAGPAAVRELRQRDKRVFLDLKLFDVPETVKRAAAAAAALGADFLTVHAAGLTVAAAVEATSGSNLGILAVTVLTSLGPEEVRAMGWTGSVADLVLERARRAQAVGAAGVVASPLEAAALRRTLGAALTIVTPGIRPAGADAGDQKRIAAPAAALAAGADYLVVGRP